MTTTSETTTASPRTKRSRTGDLLVAWLAVAATVAALVRVRSAPDVDLWLHLRIGAELRDGVRFGALPDPLVVLADRPYVPTQWLAQVAGSALEQAGGVTAVHAARALGLVLLAGLVHATARRWAGPLASVVIALGVLVATAAGWGERPQLLGIVLVALALFLWSGTLLDLRPRWTLLPVTWVWAMCHGSWPVGVAVGALVLTALVTDRRRSDAPWGRLLALLTATALVPALTPLGPGALLEPFAVGTAARATVNEWQSPAPTNPLLLLVVAFALVVAARAVLTRRADPATLLLAAAGVGLAVSSVRTIALGALLLGPALARAVGRADATPRRRSESVVAVGVAAAFLLVPGVVWGGPEEGPLPGRVDAALSALPPDTRTAVDARASGWVLWAHPEVGVLRDLRAEVYSPATAAAYEDFFSARTGWREYAAAHAVGAVLARDGERIDDALATQPGWSRVEQDDGWALWTRDASR